jgi:hypothetical protein
VVHTPSHTNYNHTIGDGFPKLETVALTVIADGITALNCSILINTGFELNHQFTEYKILTAG